ncbi:DMR6-LIKE OXYGENASE 2-like protein [Drosera capensis]
MAPAHHQLMVDLIGESMDGGDESEVERISGGRERKEGDDSVWGVVIEIDECGIGEACQDFGTELEKLAFKLLELIALSLGLAADKPEGRHKDSGALTILVQDEVGGLQVRHKTDGEWTSVNPTPGAFIINVGDIIQLWSNDKYESVEHRVMVNSERDRFSIPLKFNPAHYVVVKLLPEQNPAKYKGYNWGEFFAARKGSNFKKLAVENVQISHFRLV